MTVLAVRAAAATTATQASRQALKPTMLLAPGIVTVATAYRKKFSHRSAASTSVFGGQDSHSYGIPRLPVQRSSSDLPRAYKNEFFRLPFPLLDEKPEWWWRTLACLPYLIALQLSDAGYFLQPFLEHHDYFQDLIYFVPGAVSRLPPWFTMLYYYIAYIGIVKNKEWPHFLGVGLAYILVLLQCVRCALAGGYAHIPGISDAALIHTLFNLGGFQRPF
ncbi:hypothetical protein GH714_004011 [Hevea brasiliensis]|uniref:Protein TIC 20 n=1 Tax=Hevea brasiliensis TaxID=3981 RepID=A0A6A6MYS4_HEVBR|nr:hypothetical protein GH714_004011 [Hevea brasiliensis]